MPPRRRRGETVAVQPTPPRPTSARARAQEPPRRSTGPARWDDLRYQVSCPTCPGLYLSRSVNEDVATRAMADHVNHHPGHQPELSHL